VRKLRLSRPMPTNLKMKMPVERIINDIESLMSDYFEDIKTTGSDNGES
jgi:hypothetical protein